MAKITDKRWFSPVYMFIATAVLSSIIIGFSNATSERVEANAQLAYQKSVIMVLPNVDFEKSSGIEILKFYESLTEPNENTGGAYTFYKDGKLAAYALPFEGQGFWAPIKGIIGVLPDRKTVIALMFYLQSETPGLGAEITAPEFYDQYKEKILADGDKPIIMKRAGDELDASSIQAITGATQTSVRVEKMINNAIVEWRKKLDND